MELDYELLAEKEMLELKNLAQAFVTGQIGNVVWNFIWLFSSLITLISAIIILATINYWIICIVVIGLLINSYITMHFVKLSHTLQTNLIKKQRVMDYFNGIGTDFINAKDIRIFDMSEKIQNKAYEAIRSIFKIFKKTNKYSNIQGLIGSFLSYGIEFSVYIVLGIDVLHNGLSLGSFSLAVGTIALFRNAFSQISNTLITYTDTAKYIEYYFSFMSFESKFRKTGVLPLHLKENDSFVIEFKNVSFKYPGQENFALENFNLKINSGQKISIVGENGAGKTTFIKLLLRLYDPTNGVILLNYVDIKTIDYDEYLSIYATLFQDFKLFAFTIGENISSFDDEIDLLKMKNVTIKSGLSEKIEELPNKYDTFLFKLFDETGIEFSGGEQQKLAIARVYYKNNALITILDEPTSALDPRAEFLLYKQFNDLVELNTAFYISHRLSSSKFCDKIMLIEHGKVKEFGSHDELISLNGVYAEMYNMQAGYYV
jgi:ATP-binding cassette subfamily B protein